MLAPALFAGTHNPPLDGWQTFAYGLPPAPVITIALGSWRNGGAASQALVPALPARHANLPTPSSGHDIIAGMIVCCAGYTAVQQAAIITNTVPALHAASLAGPNSIMNAILFAAFQTVNEPTRGQWWERTLARDLIQEAFDPSAPMIHVGYLPGFAHDAEQAPDALTFPPLPLPVAPGPFAGFVPLEMKFGTAFWDWGSRFDGRPILYLTVTYLFTPGEITFMQGFPDALVWFGVSWRGAGTEGIHVLTKPYGDVLASLPIDSAGNFMLTHCSGRATADFPDPPPEGDYCRLRLRARVYCHDTLLPGGAPHPPNPATWACTGPVLGLHPGQPNPQLAIENLLARMCFPWVAHVGHGDACAWCTIHGCFKRGTYGHTYQGFVHFGR